MMNVTPEMIEEAEAEYDLSFDMGKALPAAPQPVVVKPLLGARIKLNFDSKGRCTSFYKHQVAELQGEWVWLIEAKDGMNDPLYASPTPPADDLKAEEPEPMANRGDQLWQIIRRAVVNTRQRHPSMRGPYVISDEELDACIASIIADETKLGPEDQATIAMVKAAIASAERVLVGDTATPPDDMKAENERLREALEQLLFACEEDFGVPDENDEDDEAVGASLESKMAVTFGHLRRARAALKGGQQ